MRTSSIHWLVTAAATPLVMGAVVVGQATSAWAAAPPANDNRADAAVLQPSHRVSGTLVAATLEATKDQSSCTGTDSSVWYEFTAPDSGVVALRMAAGGQMDASVDVYRKVRSRLNLVTCTQTDDNGKATIEQDGLRPGGTYLVRVGNEVGSTASTFTLKLLVPAAPPTPPGRHLPRVGVRDHVNRIFDPGDAWRHTLTAGRTMRLSLKNTHCDSLEVFAPGTTSFDTGDRVAYLPCGGFRIFTPDRSGTYFFVVRVTNGFEVQHYRLQVAPAGADDTVPGIRIHNHHTVKGHVNGGIDSRDLYRFDVTHRSALRLSVSGGPSLTLVRDTGERVASGQLITRTVLPGRFYVAVDGAGAYALHLSLRTVTHATLLVNGHRGATIRPSATARFLLRVQPVARGASDLTIERFDPISGWQFLRTYHPRVVNGVARVRFHPPTIGRYRARATYLGSRNSAPSASRVASLVVRDPLTP